MNNNGQKNGQENSPMDVAHLEVAEGSYEAEEEVNFLTTACSVHFQ